MSMSIHAVGFRPADEKWNKMLAVYNACVASCVAIPKEVDKFFDGEDPTDMPGKEVKIDEACRDYSAEMVSGIEVDITKLPKDVTIIRFIISY